MRNKLKYCLIIYFILVGVVLFKFDDLSNVAVTSLEYVKCGSATGIPRPVPQLTTIAYTMILVGAPLVLVAFSIITIVKAVSTGKEEELNKAKNIIIKRIIIIALVFLSNSLIYFVLFRVTSNATDEQSLKKCISCFLYYSEGNCLESDTGNDISTSNYRVSNIHHSDGTGANPKSNSSSNSTSNGNATTKNEQIAAIRNMMFAVETGGMVYGNQDYANFGPCYNLASTEVSITIGAGGWMGNDAKILLEKIRSEYPNTFSANDKAGIGNDLDTKNWGAYCVSRGSAQHNSIIAIITSEDGKKAQNALMEEQVMKYIDEANTLGITDIKAQAMYIDYRHVGGPKGSKRLINHATKPYTFDSIYSVSQQAWSDDTCDRNSRKCTVVNSVLYKNRHESFKKWINDYL